VWFELIEWDSNRFADHGIGLPEDWGLRTSMMVKSSPASMRRRSSCAVILGASGFGFSFSCRVDSGDNKEVGWYLKRSRGSNKGKMQFSCSMLAQLLLLTNGAQYSRLCMKRLVDAKYWIEKLGLKVHPEGGYFRQTYKSELRIAPEASGRAQAVVKGAGRTEQPRLHGSRAASTGIYFLLEGKNFSAFHRLRSDEMWHFYAGSPLVVHVLDPAGEYSSILLGGDPEAGQVFQAIVRAGCWFAAKLAQDPHFSPNPLEVECRPYALVGCTVAPGFEFEDFELARREDLEAKYPGQKEMIQKLTRRW
jgi:uncharacterized protein